MKYWDFSVELMSFGVMQEIYPALQSILVQRYYMSKTAADKGTYTLDDKVNHQQDLDEAAAEAAEAAEAEAIEDQLAEEAENVEGGQALFSDF